MFNRNYFAFQFNSIIAGNVIIGIIKCQTIYKTAIVVRGPWHQMLLDIPTEQHKHRFGFLGEYCESLLLKASLLQLAAIYSSSYMMVPKKKGRKRTLTKRKKKKHLQHLCL